MSNSIATCSTHSVLTIHSEILEVDSKEPSAFEVDLTSATFSNPAQRERMAALFARYNLPHDADAFRDSFTNDPVRVPRSSRQRVHGKRRASPAPSDKASSVPMDESEERDPTIAADSGSPETKRAMPLPEPQTGGNPARQERIYRPIKQRVRHYCENCSAMFPARSNVCLSCNHKRCRDCTRRPLKRRKREPEQTGETEAVRTVEKSIAELEVPIPSSSTAQEEASKS